MKKKHVALVGVALAALALTQTVHAVPITGNIGFSGTANLDSSSAQTAAEVVTWGPNVVGSTSGSFVSVAIGSAVTLAPAWFFTSGSVNNFWSVGGFTFNLTSSSIHSQDSLFLNDILTGTVSGNGFTTTAFSGAFSVQNPPSDGKLQYTESFSFNPPVTPVPEGGNTAMLFGAALSGLALVKSKFLLA
jgi:hypothetical protein